MASTRLEGELQAVADAQVAGFFVGVGDDGSIFESRFYFCHFKTCWSKNDMFAPKKESGTLSGTWNVKRPIAAGKVAAGGGQHVSRVSTC